MRKYIISIALALFAATTFAQTIDEALMFSQKRYEGTARTMGMGNAFTALGGDIGALPINPASSGMFRYSQFTISPSFLSSYSESDYLGNLMEKKATRFSLSNLGFVASFDTGNRSGLLNYNLGIAVNRTNSFNSIMSAFGDTDESSYLGQIASNLAGINSDDLQGDDTYDPFGNSYVSWTEILAWNTFLLSNIDGVKNDYIASTENIDGDDIFVGGPLAQDFYRKTKGGTQDITINFGGNVSDKFFFGANLNLVSLNYIVEENYKETAFDSNDFQDGFKEFETQYRQTTTGSGVNLQAGFIAVPFYGFRIGASITSPTWFSMSDSWIRDMSSSFNNGNRYYEKSPDGYYNYNLTTPMRWNVGAALVLGRVGLISLDYEGVNYKNISLANDIGNMSPYSEENREIRSTLRNANLFRLGVEGNLSSSVALRAGYNFYQSPNEDFANIHYYTFGVGFKFGSRGKNTFDIAYQRMASNSEYFTIYDDYGIAAPEGLNTNRQSKLVFTLGFKF